MALGNYSASASNQNVIKQEVDWNLSRSIWIALKQKVVIKTCYQPHPAMSIQSFQLRKHMPSAKQFT